MERFHAVNTFLEHIGLIAGFMLAAVLVEMRSAARSQNTSSEKP